MNIELKRTEFIFLESSLRDLKGTISDELEAYRRVVEAPGERIRELESELKICSDIIERMNQIKL